MSYLKDKDYDLIYSNSPRLCIDLVIRDRVGTLLVKRNAPPYKGTWHLPGGRVRFRESIKDAANRISKSELGIGVKIKKLIGCMEFMRETQYGSKRHSVSLAFLAIPNSPIKIKKHKCTHPVHLKFLKLHNLI